MHEVPEEFNDASFWEKVKAYALAAGREVIEKALWLYYALQRPETPIWAKTTIVGALAYFILPIDAIPDVIPVVGYSDDLGALAAAVSMVSMHITKEVKALATEKLDVWFGENKT